MAPCPCTTRSSQLGSDAEVPQNAMCTADGFCDMAKLMIDLPLTFVFDKADKQY
jgi:hypothetical protein